MLPDYGCSKPPRSSKARCWTGVGVVIRVNPGRPLGGLDAVGGDGGQVGQQGGEAVHRRAVGGVLGSVLGQRRG